MTALVDVARDQALEVADRWLAAQLDDVTLAGLCPGGVWSELAPPEAPLPVVVFSLQTAADVTGAPGQWVLTRATYLVKVITEGRAHAHAAVARLNALLHEQAGDVAGVGRVGSCLRALPFSLTESDQATVFRHRGGFYDLLIEHL